MNTPTPDKELEEASLKHAKQHPGMGVDHSARMFYAGARWERERLEKAMRKALHILERIQGFCEHADEPTGELCECSTEMSLDAGKATALLSTALGDLGAGAGEK
jgi:hypothetical protein